jgi:Tol biopolymer transport system component
MNMGKRIGYQGLWRIVTIVALMATMALVGCVGREVTVPGKIAFISRRIDTNGNGQVGEGDDYHIYLMDPDGSNQVRLSDVAVGFGMSWSPDGRRIAASFEAHDGWNIGLLDIEQGTVDYLTNDANVNIEPTWSPDGRSIAFASDRAGGEFQIYVINTDGTDIRLLTKVDREAFHPTWSTGNRLIAFQISYPGQVAYIRVVDMNGSTIGEIEPFFGGRLEWPVFSPNGKSIACYENPLESENQLVIFSFPEESAPPKVLGHGLFPQWSPGGQQIIFSTLAGDFDSYEICVINVDGSGLKCLTNNEFLDACPIWYGG